MKRRVGFVLKQGSAQAAAMLTELAPRWIKQGLSLVLLGAESKGLDLAGVQLVSRAEFARSIDLLVVLGGDGTLLWASSLLEPDSSAIATTGKTEGATEVAAGSPSAAPSGGCGGSAPDVPILGVNLGSLGFLTAFLPAEAEAATFAALRGELPIHERMRLCVELQRTDGKRERNYALNDCVISQGALARLLDLEAFLGAERITTYKADGLIIATPTGSTAYNLAAGGPIMTPHLEAIVITPICPHTLTNRPLVVPGASQIVIRPGPVPAAPVRTSRIVVTIDGHFDRELGPSESVTVSRASRPLQIVASPARSYFEVLRQKLRWGERAK